MENLNFSQIYNQKTKHLEDAPLRKVTEMPKEWETIFYKSYPRLKKIELPLEEINFDLFEAIRKRASRRNMRGQKISKKDISTLLKYSCGKTRYIDGFWRRAYPSAGARYPIEAYIFLLKSSDDLEPGIFHYNVKDHELEKISKKFIDKNDIENIVSQKLFGDVSMLIFLTGVFRRTQNKYGDRGYRFILQEAGHIGQNIHLVSEALNLSCCILGGFSRYTDEDVEKMLRIDGITESLVYSLAIGK